MVEIKRKAYTTSAESVREKGHDNIAKVVDVGVCDEKYGTPPVEGDEVLMTKGGLVQFEIGEGYHACIHISDVMYVWDGGRQNS